jgi:hypothetical protein
MRATAHGDVDREGGAHGKHGPAAQTGTRSDSRWQQGNGGTERPAACRLHRSQHVDPGGAFVLQSGRTLFSRLAVCSAYLHFPCPQHERTDPLPRYESPPRHVIEARYVGDYKVWLEFNDGRKGVVDLADELHGENRSFLRNRDLFSSFYLDYGLASIAWIDGVDFAPEFLYERLKEMH